ncbi:MAG: AMP-binding protein [Ignavibacteriales bacterium]|nr:AMP-binding protein [Ignavibacteriales bacterium]
MSSKIIEMKNLKSQFLAGKSSFSDSEKNNLIANAVIEISKIDLKNEEVINDEFIKEFHDMLHSLQEGDFVIDFLIECSEEIFYKTGLYIEELFKIKELENSEYVSELCYLYLNYFRHSEFLQKISDQKKWTDLVSKLIDYSNFNTRVLFKQRVSQYSKRTLFNVLLGTKITSYSWEQIDNIVKQYSASILNLIENKNSKPRIAFLTENSLTMALMDFACLNSGTINVMIPANSVPQHISYIINQTECDYILVSNEKQLVKLKSVKKDIPSLKKAVLIEGTSAEDWVISFKEFIDLAKANKDIVIEDNPINSPATLMYTSGTTGEPKGIIFTQKNIIFKRFCRAIALPKINDSDSFLAYLPLYHTFGRWLELMGSIFWGTTYSFMENPSAETMMANMQMVKPTIFISIPKKWMQLYEHISSQVDIEHDEEEKIKNEVLEVTGGKLKWGLSAAGYLSPEVFLFFQKYNIQLMSGFGMTEATGGITMTPPNAYTPNSLGKALPGIEIKVAKDGELLVKGEYVMLGYFDQKADETFVDDGWFPTGDIMKMDANGFIEIIDRKKEIYKNIKGETIAPQRIENLFRDFEAVQQVFVVGDHRPFNTVLIYPDLESTTLKDMFDDQKGEYFSNLIVTINKFLAPFERIVDFRIIDRPFSAEKGELTPKNTFKRRVIEENFKSIIDHLYQKDYYSLFLDKTEIKIPNWFLRERGCLTGDIKINESKLVIPKLNKELTLQKISKDIFRIGDFSYRILKKQIDFHEFLINPIYWLGNEELVQFTDDAILQWYRQNNEEDSIRFVGRYENKNELVQTKLQLNKIHAAGEKSLFGMHLALVLMRSENLEYCMAGFHYFEDIFKDELQEIFKIALYFLDKPIIATNSEAQKKLFLLAITHTKPANLKNLFERYLLLGPILFDDTILSEITNNKKCLDAVDIIDDILNEKIQLRFQSKNLKESVLPILIDILARFGIRHPTKYEELRRKLVNVQLIQDWPELSELAQEYRTKMRKGFRKWLGNNEIVAVDIETGEEYGWDDVIIFEEDIKDSEKTFLKESISTTPIIREAIFLFSKGNIVRLSNILPRGVWISKQNEDDKAIIYRVSVHTRHQGAFDILLHKNKNRSLPEIKAEVNWLILAGSRYFLTELVEDFGGYWDSSRIWTQKYQPGLTVAQLFNRDVKKDPKLAEEKYYYLWPFFIWNATAAYINFWRLTSGRMQLANPTPENIIIPSHDYQLGTRFVSLSNRSKFTSFTDLFFNFYNNFVLPIEEKYPFVKRESSWKYVFPGIINAEGEQEGIEILSYFLIELKDSNIENKDKIISQLHKLLDNIKENGYIPKQLYFAIKRFIRWNNINENASIGAQAQMLNELFDTYNLVELENSYPETRTRFYLETVFRNSGSKFKNVITDLCKQQHENRIAKDEFMKETSRIQNEFNLDEKETYFMARLSYPHLKPSDSASFLQLSTEGEHSANLVVQVEDLEGNPFYIRKPVSPKEISKLYQLFLDANLQVGFKPEHNFIVAISDRGFIIGGLFYSFIDKEVVHMEKIVVSNRFRRQGVSELIMDEFFNRMKDEGFGYVTTGFFRPEYFYKFGFKIEKKYSGLVKELKK